jgi:cardiolipin synthase A/B
MTDDAAPVPRRRPTLQRITRTLLGLKTPQVAPAPQSHWQSERVTADFDRYLAELEQDIASAKRMVLLEVYILGDDVIGRRIEAALSAAASRGVRVLLAVDGIGSPGWIEQRAGKLSHRGVHVRVYHPPPWQIAGFTIPTRQRMAAAGRWFRYINRRNHRKTCVIDGRVAWVGSMNLTREHSVAELGDRAWRDTVARVEGEQVRLLMRAFIAAWRRSWRVVGDRLQPSFSMRSLHLPQSLDGLVRLNHGLRMRRRYYRDLIARITHARQRVWIANAYFVPQGSLIEALGAAAANGADVRVIVPAQSDVWFMPYVAATFADALARVGVRLYQYQPRMLHDKSVLIDNWVSVGSTNLNNRSLRHDLEADVVLTTPASLRAVEEILTADIAESVDATASTHRPPWWVLTIGTIMLLLRRWI